jgi:peptidoglycan/LPS O-acetylase OafA/YrhL
MQWKVLAGLRFFLAFIVFSYHLKDYVPDYGRDLFCQIGKLNGLAAVLGFLLVSGYSIAHSVSKEASGFYQRRIFRIYPLYLCAVLFSISPFLFLGETLHLPDKEIYGSALGTVLGHFLFLQGFVIHPLSINLPFWTLSVEVACYLLAPFLVKLNDFKIIGLIVTSALFYVGFPNLYQTFYPQSPLPFYSAFSYAIPFGLFLWAWLIGFLIYRRKSLFQKALLVGLGAILLLLNNQFIGKIGIVTYLFSGMILIGAPYLPLPKPLSNLLNYLGDLSYPLYLFHVPTLVIAYLLFGIRNSFSFIFISFVVSMLFYHGVDVPCRLSKKTKPTAQNPI